ncbi:kinase-like domain-containing protein [Glomus cerebriforme]|uniref:Kinase-like domain-containing protein n=1 Tax=Glomus cerebriforme TaxID=658196 RepID=A0A397SSY7_9GLOM|nr:kinase-like domain-containing protein [Glomus cerebriforme]
MTTWIENGLKNQYIQKYPYDRFQNIEYNGQSGGEGRFSLVASAEWSDTNRKVALKKLKNYDVDKFVSEVRMHSTGHSSKNIVRFLGLTNEKESVSYIMVLEYADRNNLRTFLQKGKNLGWSDKVRLSLDIAKGLSYLHLLNIAHRDLHSNNVVINQVHGCNQPEYIAKITDFGSAINMDEDNNDVNGVIGQIPFTDPKYLDDHKNYRKDLRSDIYSLGVMFWEISSCKVPFGNFMPESRGDFRDLCLAFEIIISTYRERIVPRTPQQFADLYQRCWDGEPSERPNIKTVIEELDTISNIISVTLSNSLNQTKTIGQ